MQSIQMIQNQDLSILHTFRMPGYAHQFIRFEDLSQLPRIAEVVKKQLALGQPFLVLGEGSNSIFLNHFEGLILQILLKGIQFKPAITEQHNQADVQIVEAKAGESWDDFVRWTLDHQLYGLENLSAIPGLVGACPIQNIGAYGVEVESLIHRVEVFDWQAGKSQWLLAKECGFAYRDSYFKSIWRQKYCILAVEFCLSKIFKPTLTYGPLTQYQNNQNLDAQQLSQVIREIRAEKLPDPYQVPNAGSFFKNPLVDLEHFQALKLKYPHLVAYAAGPQQMKLSAAWLIDQAGLKGFKYSEFQVSPRQALVLTHLGHELQVPESGQKLMQLIKKIQFTVFERFQVMLESEPQIY